jgi:hypothetical protein
MTVIASDSEAIQAKPQLLTLSLDRFALLAMTESVVADRIVLRPSAGIAR